MSDGSTKGRVGADTGGTFTDLVRWDGASGEVVSQKVLSTPDDPSRAIEEGMNKGGWSREELQEVIHGTTVATNALLERRGASVALVTTAGFEDTLWLGRQQRPELYSLRVRRPRPVIDRWCVIGVDERVDHEGQVVRPLSQDEVEQVLTKVMDREVEAVVICLLHAYANGEHERRLAKALREANKGWHVTASSELSATLREYERMSTTAINGYVGPVMEHYLARLKRRLEGVERLDILQSHGGRCDVEMAAQQPVHTVLSGPAGGVVGALKAAGEAGRSDIITFDMGGTSTDVSLARGEPAISQAGSIADMPLQVPIVDIHTVGAGGGSVASVDRGGALRVGPKSAGADPGPAAYGRGGVEATVTDAHVVLGTLPEGYFLGGEMELDRRAARAAVGRLAGSLDRSVEETARAILEVVDAAMARAIKVISVYRGEDPREYSLVAFGGAGGLHGCRLAERLDMTEVIVPRHAGLCSAMGMLRAPARRLYAQTVQIRLQDLMAGKPSAEARIAEVEARWMELARGEMDDHTLETAWTASLRYEGQSFSLEVELGPVLRGLDWEDVAHTFHRRHEAAYGYGDRDLAVELVGLRLQASARDRATVAPKVAPSAPTAGARPVEAARRRRIDFGEGEVKAPIVEWSELVDDRPVEGPLIIADYSTTVVVLEGWSAILRGGHVVLERPMEEGR